MKFSNKHYDTILDHGLLEIKPEEKIVLEIIKPKEKKKIPFSIEPYQKFKLWNSKGGSDLIMSSGLVLVIAAAVYFALFFLGKMALNSTGEPTSFEKAKGLYLIPFFACGLLLMMFVYFDIMDYRFRKGSSYSFLKKGIAFNLKKDYLLEWKRIKSIHGDKDDDKIFFKLKDKKKSDAAEIYIEPGNDYDFLYKLISGRIGK